MVLLAFDEFVDRSLARESVRLQVSVTIYNVREASVPWNEFITEFSKFTRARKKKQKKNREKKGS